MEPASGVPKGHQAVEPIADDTAAAAAVLIGKVRGHFDTASRQRLTGWALDTDHPNRSVGLVISINDQVVTRVMANRFRGDLKKAGIGDGRHAFEVFLPSTLPMEADQVVRIQRECDGIDLQGSPKILPARGRFDGGLEAVLTDALEQALSPDQEAEALALLSRQMDRLLTRRAERRDGARLEVEAIRRRSGPEAARALDNHAPRVLIIDDQVPVATRDAGSVAILSHLRAFKALGYAVTFAASRDMACVVELDRLAEAEGVATCSKPTYGSIEDVLAHHKGGFEAVYLHRLANAERYLKLVRAYVPRARVIYSVADLHHLRLSRQAEVEGRPELIAAARAMEHAEFLAASQADLVLTHSPVEAATLRRHIRPQRVHVAPFAVAEREPLPSFAARDGVAFVGSFTHAPNRDAVHWLTREILPKVWAQDPSIRCKIVGHGWRPDVLPGLDPRVAVLGPVEDLDALFATVRLTVAPLRFGAGIKGKVLDSFAAGLPCVMTPIAAEGLVLDGGLDDLVRDTAAAIAAAIVQLHAGETDNARTGAAAKALATQAFSQDRVTEALAKGLEGHAGPTRLAG